VFLVRQYVGWNLSSIISCVVVVALVLQPSNHIVSGAVGPLNGALIVLKLVMGKLVPVQVRDVAWRAAGRAHPPRIGRAGGPPVPPLAACARVAHLNSCVRSLHTCLSACRCISRFVCMCFGTAHAVGGCGTSRAGIALPMPLLPPPHPSHTHTFLHVGPGCVHRSPATALEGLARSVHARPCGGG
jgi:hypothetical protein